MDSDLPPWKYAIWDWLLRLMSRSYDEEYEGTIKILVRTFFATALLIPPIAGLVTAQLTTFGRAVKPDFMTVLAQVLPVLVLAALLEDRTAISRHLSADRPSQYVNQAATTVLRILIGWLMLGEVCCMYSVATGTVTTFLVVTASLAALLAALDMVSSARHVLGAGFRPRTSDKSAGLRKHEERLRQRIKQFTDEADKTARQLDQMQSAEYPHPDTERHRKKTEQLRLRVSRYRDAAQRLKDMQNDRDHHV
jgi:hypothetical protein